MNVNDKIAGLSAGRRGKVEARAAELIGEELTLRELRSGAEADSGSGGEGPRHHAGQRFAAGEAERSAAFDAAEDGGGAAGGGTGGVALQNRQARRIQESEGVALNQFTHDAVPEKLSALRTEEYFRERAARADWEKAKRISTKAGKGKAPVARDEVVGRGGSPL